MGNRQIAAEGSSPGEVTGLLVAWQNGDSSALERLMPLVYAELHRIAERHLRRERPGHTLQPSAMVNETYLKLVESPVARWQDRVHFFAVAARVMRQILVDYARRRGAQKRGGGQSVSRMETVAWATAREVDVIAVDDALRKLSTLDDEQARVVELRFFGGLTVEEAAEALGVSAATVHRKWIGARAWLHRELSGSTP